MRNSSTTFDSMTGRQSARKMQTRRWNQIRWNQLTPQSQQQWMKEFGVDDDDAGEVSA